MQIQDSVSDREKGEVFWQAMKIAGEEVPDHDWRTGEPPEMTVFLESLGIKTWVTFTKHALYMDVTWYLGRKTLEFSPWKYEHGGFSGIKDVPDLEIPDDSSLEEIGETIETTLGLCIGQGSKRKSEFEKKSECTKEQTCYGVSFGYKHFWLAIKSNNMKKVASALGIKNPKETDWGMGIEKSYQNHVFVTPSIGQWILAVGYEAEDAKMESLSKEFGEVQSFATHRGSDYHGWTKAVDGKIIRAFAVCGDVTEMGEPTPVERKLIDFSDEDFATSIDEETVMQVAAGWSVNPMDLESREGIAEYGLLG